MPTSFQEFLRQKTEGSDWRERKRLREEWIGNLQRLLDQIREWIRESDPEGVIELVPYRVERVEGRLGVYDAPALQIRLNTESADVVPMDRFTQIPTTLRNTAYIQETQDLSLAHVDQYFMNEPVGRVDITNEERAHRLLFHPRVGWQAWISGRSGRFDQAGQRPFDKAALEAILEDLLS